MRTQGLGLWMGLALGTVTAAVSAQSVTTPGVVGDTLKPPPELLQPQAAPAVTAPPERPQADAPPAGGRAVSVQRFEFYGNTLYPGAELEALVKDYTGRELTLLDIYEAADKVTDFYVRQGYTLASVNVPAQKVADGVVYLEVQEGRVGEIKAEGGRRYTAEHLAPYLPGVQQGSVYQGSELEQGMVQLNELPGLQARAVLKPGDAYGSSDIVIQAKEDLFQGGFIIDNYGRENIGEYRATATATFNNPLGVEDQLQLLGLVSEDALLKYGYAAYSLPMNFRGTRLEMSYGEARFEVDDDLLGVEGSNRSGRVGVSHPFLRSRTDRVVGTAAISNTNSDAGADLFGGAALGDTNITLIELGSTWNHTYSTLAVTQVMLGLASNFDQAESRAELNTLGERDHQRIRVEIDAQHLQPLSAGGLALLLRVNGVYSPDPLADTQQFSLGGPNSVRGYPASEVRGDKGVFGSLTLRQPLRLGPVMLYARAFVDSGRVWLYNDVGADAEASLSSFGIGTDLQYAGFSAKLDWSFPSNDRDTSDGHDDHRLFGSLSMSF